VKYLSVCSGIEAASVAWHPLGFEAFAYSEIDKFPCAALAHHYPTVPNFGDMTKFKEWPDATVDILVGGTPCQSFSVAGLRKGLDDPRGNLTLTYLAIAAKYRPKWLVWENVPGILSDKSRAFGAFLGGLGQLGYGFAYRILDAQFCGVPQRRRRVFVVGHLGDWRRAAAVLFERHSLQGHPAPSREKREGTTYPVAPCIGASGRGFERTGDTRGNDAVVAVAPTLRAGGNRTGGDRPYGTDVDTCDSLQVYAFNGESDGSSARNANDVANPIICRHGDPGFIAHSLRAEGFDASEDGTGRGTPLVPIAFQSKASHHQSMNPNTISPTLEVGKSDGVCVAFDCKASNIGPSDDLAATMRSMGHAGSHQNWGGHQAVAFTASEMSNSFAWEKEVYPTLNAQIPNDSSNIQMGVRLGMQVRRLTPTECERLQGFPDDYTLIPFTHGKPAADGPRYKALGNSMAVPVMRWIGERIAMVAEVA